MSDMEYNTGTVTPRVTQPVRFQSDANGNLKTADANNASMLTATGAVGDAAVTDPAQNGSLVALAKGILGGGTRKTKTLASAYINTTATGDISIVSGTASQTIRVHRIWFTNGAAATTLLFKDANAGTTLGGVDLQPGGSFFLDYSAEPHFVTATAGAFTINSSVSSQLRGMVEYIKSA